MKPARIGREEALSLFREDIYTLAETGHCA